jgi:hypothetical protein
MPVAAALAIGLPIFIGAAYGELGLGLAASLGGLVFLHLPATRLSHRMAWLMACAFCMTGSHALGMLGHLVPSLVVGLLVIVAVVVTMVCRFYAAPPPGGLFFVMAAAVHGARCALGPGAAAPRSLGEPSLLVHDLALGKGAGPTCVSPTSPRPSARSSRRSSTRP